MHFAHVKKGEYAMSTKKDIKKLARELVALADDNSSSADEVREDEDIIDDRETSRIADGQEVSEAFDHITGLHLGQVEMY